MHMSPPAPAFSGGIKTITKELAPAPDVWKGVYQRSTCSTVGIYCLTLARSSLKRYRLSIEQVEVIFLPLEWIGFQGHSAGVNNGFDKASPKFNRRVL
jgi:hypothetical protein